MSDINKTCESCSGECTHSLVSKKNVIAVVGIFLSLFLVAKTIGAFKELKYIGAGVQATNIISVSGKGEVVAVPDIATFSFTVTEEAGVVAEAQKQATEKMNGILAFLKKAGVDAKDVKTTNYNIYPRYDYPSTNSFSTGKRVLAAYVVSQSVDVKVRKIENAGNLISGIGEFGAQDVSGLSFSVDKYDDLVKQAREKAIAEAKVNAEKLAKDLGVSIVRITSYYDQSPSPIYYSARVMSAKGGDAMMESAPSPELPAGENKIISNVTITYEIR
jgi:uncharacterized protein YggE